MQQCAGNHEVAPQAVGVGQEHRHFHDLQDVLEQSAAVGVVHLTRRRPHTKLVAVSGHDRLEKATDVRVLDAGNPLRQLLPHLVDRAGRGRDAVLFPKAQRGIARNHAADLVDDQFGATVEDVALALHGDELAGLELLARLVDILEDLGVDVPGTVLKDEHEERARSAGTALLARAEEVTGTG